MKARSFFSKSFATVEVLELSANSCSYTVCFFEWKSNQLHFLNYFNGSSTAELNTALLKIDACIWIINDDKVITKVVAGNSMNTALSNMKWNSFYAAAGASVLSLSRIEDFLEHKKNMQSSKKQTCFTFLGLSSIESILELLPPRFELQRHSIEQTEGKIVSIDSRSSNTEPQAVFLDGEEYPAQAVLGFAAAVTFLKGYSLTTASVFKLPNLEQEPNAKDIDQSIGSFRTLNRSLYRDFMNQFFFKRLIRFHGILVGILLIIGVSIQTYRNQIFEDKKNLQASVQGVNRSYQIISEKIKVKRAHYERMNKNKDRNVALLIDSLLLNMPNTIRLNELQYQPLKRKNTDYDTQNLLHNQFFVQGNIDHKNAFSEWKNYLETLPWVRDIKALQLNQVRTDFLQFEFIIELKNE